MRVKVVGKARLPAADLSRHVQVELPGPRAEALLFVHRARFAARATPIVARNYAFLAACSEAYEMCILLHRFTRSNFHLLAKMRADILAHIWCWWTPPVVPPSFFAFKSRSMRPR